MTDDDLLQAWLDGDLDDDDLAALRVRLRDPRHLATALRRCGDEAALHAAARALAQTSALGRRRRRLGLTLLALAAALLLALTITWWRSTGNRQAVADLPVAVLTAIDGEVLRVETGTPRPVRSGDPMPAGARLTTGAAARAVLDLTAARAVATLGPDGLCLLRGPTAVEVHRGTLTVHAEHRPPGAALAVVTPHATCTVVGTRFTVQVTSAGSLLHVDEGRVAWQPADGTACEVAAGGVARAGETLRELLRLRRDANGVRLEGGLDEPADIVGRTPLRLSDDGLTVDVSDHVTSTYGAARPRLLAALRGAAAVGLQARVRFLTPVEDNLLVAELLCEEDLPPGVPKVVQLRWRGGACPAGPAWHDLTMTLQRDGTVEYHCDGTVVAGGTMPWPFAAWGQRIQVKLLLPFGHHGVPAAPLQVVFGDLRVLAAAAP